MNIKFVFVILIFFVLPMSDCNIKSAKPEGKVKTSEKNLTAKSEPEKKRNPEKVQNPIKHYVFSFQKNNKLERNVTSTKESKINNKISESKVFSGRDFFILIISAFAILLIAIVAVQNHISSRR